MASKTSVGRARRPLRDLLAAAALTAAAAGVAAGPAAPARAAGGAPAFVQQASAHSGGSTALGAKLPGAVTAGNRLVVEVGVWSAAQATTGSVTDSAGNTYTELTHFTASDHTELSVWTAPVTVGGGTVPTVTAHPTSSADVGVAVLEYSGLSSVGDASVVDVANHAVGTTSGAGTVSGGTTAATTAANELVLGVYADSGFGNTLTAGAGFTARTTVSHVGDMELMAEDQAAGQGATPAATFGTGGSTTWLAATLVFKPESAGAPSAPAAPTTVDAVAGNASAQLTWTAPDNGGSPITSYTVTPYADGVAQAPTVLTGAPPASAATVSGLSNAVPYTFRVTATNAIGTGPASAASNGVVPDPVPQGQFGALQNWPIVAVHSVVLDNGKLLQWDGWETPEPTEL